MSLFDNFGRYSACRQSAVSTELHLKQPEINYESILMNVYGCFPRLEGKHGPRIGPVSTEQLASRSKAIMVRLKQDPTVKNILNGVHLPLLLPKLPERYYGSIMNRLRGRSNDYGTLMRDFFMPAVAESYWHTYHYDRKFMNLLHNRLADQVSIAPESRHEKLVERMSREYVVGIFFPMAFQGFSASCCRRLMASLPETFLLSGGFDLATALVCFPEALTRDSETPELSMAALNWRRCTDRLASIKTWDEATTLANYGDVGYGQAEFSAGLLVIEDNQ